MLPVFSQNRRKNMIIRNNLWKDGKHKCLTMSYDDGTVFAYRLVEIFNKYGIRGTFHLNSGFFKTRTEGTVKIDDAKKLYENHEISLHSYTHPTFGELPDFVIADELNIDRKNLEEICGYTIRGLSYPNGRISIDDRIKNICRVCGMRYGRSTEATNDFYLPQDFLEWKPTAHHGGNIDSLFDKFVNLPEYRLNMPLMYVWGHSYEFDRNNNWDTIESFCRNAGGNSDIWYATNIEIYDYVTASRSIDYGLDYHTAFNPSGISVWISVNGKPVELKPGHNSF